MKALSLHQPWASLVMLGAKRFETRSWHTHYRGPLLIHACKYIPLGAQKLAYQEPFKTALAPLLMPYRPPTAPDGNVWDLPRGCLLGYVELMACHASEKVFRDCEDADSGKLWISQTNEEKLILGPTEFAFGDYGRGRWVWHLRVSHRFEQPIPIKGRLGLWDVPDDLLEPHSAFGIHRSSHRTH